MNIGNVTLLSIYELNIKNGVFYPFGIVITTTPTIYSAYYINITSIYIQNNAFPGLLQQN